MSEFERPSTFTKKRVQTSEPTVAYTGFAATGKRSGREFVLVAPDHETLDTLWDVLMGGMALDHTGLNDVAVVTQKHLKDAPMREPELLQSLEEIVDAALAKYELVPKARSRRKPKARSK